MITQRSNVVIFPSFQYGKRVFFNDKKERKTHLGEREGGGEQNNLDFIREGYRPYTYSISNFIVG